MRRLLGLTQLRAADIGVILGVSATAIVANEVAGAVVRRRRSENTVLQSGVRQTSQKAGA
jgi:hypothetical protein